MGCQCYHDIQSLTETSHKQDNEWSSAEKAEQNDWKKKTKGVAVYLRYVWLNESCAETKLRKPENLSRGVIPFMIIENHVNLL